MKLSAIVYGTLTALATASVVRSPQPNPEPQGIEIIQQMVDAINEFPGSDAIRAIFHSLKQDKTWKVDYSDKKNGNVVFSQVGEDTCTLTQKGWAKYSKPWGKFAKASFDDPCRGGQLSQMKEGYIDKLKKLIGDGH